MSVGFGFSVGDLIAAVGLIKVSVEAIHNGKAASAEYHLLESELESLGAGLNAVEKLSIDTQTVEVAVEKAVRKCRQCIETFVKKIAKYQPSLGTGKNIGSLMVNFRRIQWALCNKEDVATFRQQVAGHASSINMLLTTLSVHQIMKVNRDQLACHSLFDSPTANLQSTIASQSRVEALSQLVPQILGNQESQGAQSNKDQSQEHLRTLVMLVPELLQEVVSMRRKVQLHTEMPAQVLLQNPVIMLDACGKIAPFHLEFITSAEAFLSILKIRFKHAGVSPQGLKKIDSSEFVLRDKQKDISLSKTWERVFKPGQRVNMSMLFHRFQPEGKCPACRHENAVIDDSEVTCACCGLEYRRIVEVDDSTFFGRGKQDDITGPCSPRNQHEGIDEMEDFRRVQVVSPETGASLPNLRQTVSKEPETMKAGEAMALNFGTEDDPGLLIKALFGTPPDLV